jgi:hypothetical protein
VQSPVDTIFDEASGGDGTEREASNPAVPLIEGKTPSPLPALHILARTFPVRAVLQRMTRERELMLIGLLAFLCLGFAWAADDGLFAAVFAIEAAVAVCGFEESKEG